MVLHLISSLQHGLARIARNEKGCQIENEDDERGDLIAVAVQSPLWLRHLLVQILLTVRRHNQGSQ
jgi:hypothetical protein